MHRRRGHASSERVGRTTRADEHVAHRIAHAPVARIGGGGSTTVGPATLRENDPELHSTDGSQLEHIDLVL